MPRLIGSRCGVNVAQTFAPDASESVCAISGVCWCLSILYARKSSATSTNE